MGGDETIDRLINFAKAQTALASLTTKQLASALTNRSDLSEVLMEMGYGRYNEKDVSRAYLKGFQVGQSAALTPENLAALGYVPEPVWRDAVNDPPPEEKDVLALSGGQGQIANRRGVCWYFSFTGVRMAYSPHLWTDCPALPGKGE